VRMNPILLKPASDTGAQVLVMGKPVGNMSVEQYIEYKSTAFAQALAAYASLAAEHDVIVLEGAGSPAEVNLKHHDIANMEMARQAHARVVIVGDIDRGGVFAAFAGTMEALAEWERQRVSGFVVNRFRGRASLLAEALSWTERTTRRPVFGVVPFLFDHGLPEEDSLGLVRGRVLGAAPGARPGRSARLGGGVTRGMKRGEGHDVMDGRALASTAADTADPAGVAAAVEIAAVADADGSADAAPAVRIVVIELPHLSNFTDFDALGVEPGVQVQFVREPRAAAALGHIDLLVIPGTKSVASDLSFLRRSGWDELIMKLAAAGRTQIAGICGGLQMLGEQILDPHGVESAAAAAPGLGLLPVVTTLEREKTLRRTRAVHLPSALMAQGYEIHHGRTHVAAARALMRRDDGEVIGVEAEFSSTFSAVPAVGSSAGSSLGAAAQSPTRPSRESSAGSSSIWGTYLHGLFDSNELRRWLVNDLRQRRGLVPLTGGLSRYDLELNLQRLADAVRASVDVQAIYRELGIA
jgi:adenosylcobyric acid synthase